MGSGFEPRTPHQIGHCTNRSFGGRVVRGRRAGRSFWLVCRRRLGYAEDRDYPIRAGDLDPGDEYLDQRLALGVAAGSDDVGDVVGDLPQRGNRRRGGGCGDLADEFVSAGPQLC